jgi:archaellum biogenesis ATPase FlaH
MAKMDYARRPGDRRGVSSRAETLTKETAMTTTGDFADNPTDDTRIISTGNSEVDKKLGGGIPEGSLMLIEGESASGKSVLTQQLIWGSLYDDHKVVLYTTERTMSSQMSQMASLGLDVLDFLLLRRLRASRLIGSAEWTHRRC